MRLLIDSNRYSEFNRGNPDVITRFERAEELWLPLIVHGELLAGFAVGSQRELNESLLVAFLERPRTGLLIPDENTSRQYAELWSAMRRMGKPIPTNDLWIARARDSARLNARYRR
jgi:predicted nucleic acid-binding protein